LSALNYTTDIVFPASIIRSLVYSESADSRLSGVSYHWRTS